MLLCSINDVRPGTVLGAVVTDPQVPGHDLLRPGVALDSAMITRLKRRGVHSVWIEDDFTRDLDAAVAPKLEAARMAVYAQLRSGLAASAKGTLTTTTVKEQRRAVMGLVLEAIGSARYASLTDSLFSSSGQAGHGANVAYLSLLTGLHLESYVVMEQKRLDRRMARDMSVLGLAGLLHDVGKTVAGDAESSKHEVHLADSGELDEAYAGHVTAGKRALEQSGAPARVTHAVLNHHQRFDGSGWPDLSVVSAGSRAGALSGRRIHIFARIVAAANVLDNLLRDADGAKRPPVAALHAFASARFDGWFDPVVRSAMLLRMPPFAIGTEVRLSDSRRAVVVEPCAEDPCRPTVRALPDSSEAEPETVALSSRRDLTITHSLGEEVGKYLYEAPAAVSVADAARAAA
ncbi:MAG: HD domain-containing protein [Phycisphaerae bacterium]|nr:HD domain-containing protein [Phycisphaerae bacterium]